MCKMLLKVGSCLVICCVFVNFMFVVCLFVLVFFWVFYNCVLLMLVGDRIGLYVMSKFWFCRKEIFFIEVVNLVKWWYVIVELSWVDYIFGLVFCSNNVMFRFLEIKNIFLII